ncbi:MAG TPA: hypothetical protein DCS35_08930 [Vibrio sp.]|nr:hypothetical protein [Vibrio sp.]
MNGLGSLKTRWQTANLPQLLSLSPHSTSLAYGTTIYDCGVFNSIENSARHVQYAESGKSFT